MYGTDYIFDRRYMQIANAKVHGRAHFACMRIMDVSKAKRERAPLFNQCNSIREVLALGKPKPERRYMIVAWAKKLRARSI